MTRTRPGPILLALLPALAVAAPPEDPMEEIARKATAEIRKRYKDPIIERQECPFPGLVYLTAFERANLAEDPLIPEQWFASADGRARESFPFEAINHPPKDEAEARALAHWLLSVEHRWSRVTATEIVADAAARRFVVTLKAEFSLAHPMFRQGTRPGRAVVTVQDGRWSLAVDDPFLERVDQK
jgi:hypothetical protein